MTPEDEAALHPGKHDFIEAAMRTRFLVERCGSCGVAKIFHGNHAYTGYGSGCMRCSYPEGDPIHEYVQERII